MPRMVIYGSFLGGKLWPRRDTHFFCSSFRHENLVVNIFQVEGASCIKIARSIFCFTFLFKKKKKLFSSFHIAENIFTVLFTTIWKVCKLANTSVVTTSNQMIRAAPVVEWVRSLYFSALNHSIISPLCLV